MLGALGILKHLHIPKPNPFDLIPVDIVSNGILVATAYHGSDIDSSKLTVYNCTTSSQNPLTVEGYKDVALENAIYFQVKGQVFRPIGISHTRSRVDYHFRKLISEQLPIYVMEALSLLPMKVSKDLK